MNCSTPANSYKTGSYFANPRRHGGDGAFKAEHCWNLLSRLNIGIPIRRYADVGCGSGDATRRMVELLSSKDRLDRAVGLDISPHVSDLSDDSIEFIHGTLPDLGATFDLVTMFDVFEHVPDATSFLRQFHGLAQIFAFHIPLEDCALYGFGNAFLERLADPGHLLFLNPVSALNILASSGFTVLGYEYTPGFRLRESDEPVSAKERILTLARSLTWRVSPYLLSRTFGGASMMVIAQAL